MGNPITLTREEAFDLLNELWESHATHMRDHGFAGAAETLRLIELLEDRLFPD